MTCTKRARLLLALGVACGATSLNAGSAAGQDGTHWEEITAIPNVIPSPDGVPLGPAKIALGRQLFFDPRLSGDNRMSCGSCHIPEKSYADGRPRSPGSGARPLRRNTPTVLNTAFLSPLFWDGRAASLEEQAFGPIESPDEMNQDPAALIEELRAIPEYAQAFEVIFHRPVNRRDIASALATFQRSLVARDSAFDRFLEGDRQALSADAQRGFELFVGEADCIRCHRGPLLSDGKFYRLGIGRSDRGRGEITGRAEDAYKFRTPSLRNVALTGPYMHDGSIPTLSAVVEYYYRNAPSSGPEGLPLDIDPLLGQSFSEIPAIVAFLESLTGQPPRASTDSAGAIPDESTDE